ncbi:MAG: hypothetical protein ACI9FN_000306 [Saprospiraceae bacterium]|jgi:hypothetical protein
MNRNRRIDHIVYAVPNLEDAIDGFEKVTGVRPIFGGYHTTQGTKNALVNLSNGCYLELLAIDHSNNFISDNRWMGIDLITAPKVTRWALKTKDILKDSIILQSHNSEMGQVKGGQRKMTNGKILKWKLAMPLASPEVEIIPFITDWQASDTHPTDSLPAICQLVHLKLTHPKVDLMQGLLDELGYHLTIEDGKNVKISISIQCPNGIVEL